jgi:hypothetical protein
MDRVDIWYMTDYDGGKTLVKTLETLGFTVHLVEADDFLSCAINQSSVHMFIIDCVNIPLDCVIAMLHGDPRIQNYQKFIISSTEEIEKAMASVGALMHVDFISRPFNRREFIILLEKAVVVEKYREMMKNISKEAEGRIEEFESLIHIHKKDMFTSEREQEVFGKIMAFESKLLEEQKKLNTAIREFTSLRQKELFELKNRIHAEELLDSFRRNEMIDYHKTIKAQQAVLDFSSKELDVANKIIKASEITGELSREEAILLHETLRSERERGENLAREVESLKKQLTVKK